MDVAPVVIAALIHWPLQRAVDCQGVLGDGFVTPTEVARSNQCALDYDRLFAATPTVILAILALIAFIRVGRDPRPAVGVATALVAYIAAIIAWGGQWAAAQGGQLLTYSAGGTALLLSGAAIARVATLPPTQTT